MSRGRTGILYNPQLLKHSPRSDLHPEKPERISKTFDYLEKQGTLNKCVLLDPKSHLKYDISEYGVHLEDYFDQMSQTKDGGKYADVLDLLEAHYENDVYFNHETFNCAYTACNDLINMCDSIADGMILNGFALIRPPGHHAEYSAAMGFCIFNNVAIAVRHVKSMYGDPKVLVIDWDIHHGNGIQQEFYNDPDVLYISIHRFDNGTFYPGKEAADHYYVGSGPGMGKNVNIPWPCGGMTDTDYVHVFQKIIMPIAMEFNPSYVFVSAGFDAAEGDPLGECHVSPQCFGWMTSILCTLSSSRIVMCLEGGYNCDAVAKCVNQCIYSLLGQPPAVLKRGQISSACHQTVQKVLASHSPYWECFSRSYSIAPQSHKRTHLPLRQLGELVHFNKLLYDLKFVELDLNEAIYTKNQRYLQTTVLAKYHSESKDEPLVVFAYPGLSESLIVLGNRKSSNSIELDLEQSVLCDLFSDFIEQIHGQVTNVILLEVESLSNDRYPQEFTPPVTAYLKKKIAEHQGPIVFIGIEAAGVGLCSHIDEVPIPRDNWYSVFYTRSKEVPSFLDDEYLKKWWLKNSIFFISSKHKTRKRLDLDIQGSIYSIGCICPTLSHLMDAVEPELLNLVKFLQSRNSSGS